MIKMNLNALEQVPPMVYATIAVCTSMMGILLGTTLSPWFSWFDNALSDIGVYQRGFLAASIFNGCLITAGVTTILYSFSRYKTCTDSLGEQLGIRLLTAGGIALSAIGIFPETSPPFHFIASVLFFVLVPFSMWAFAAGQLIQKRSNYFSLMSLSLPFISLINWGSRYYSGVALPELVAGITFWIWIFIFTRYYMVKVNSMVL